MYYFDSFKHNYISLQKSIVYPSISLLQFDFKEISVIYKILLENFPNFSEEFKIFNQEILIGQKKYYSFLKIAQVHSLFSALELRILVSYAGGASKEEILEMQLQNFSPSFKTNKIYYHLFLYLIHSFKEKSLLITEIEPYYISLIRTYKIPYIDTKLEPWTVNLFDEIDFSDLLNKIESKIHYKWKGKLWKRPFSIERATLAINLVAIEQEKFVLNDFYNFIINIEKGQYESRTLQEFFTEWEVERCFSNSGNIHWKFTKIPFIKL